MIGHWEIIVILVVALLLFGSRLPSLARGMGRSLVEFKKGMRGIEDEISREPERPRLGEAPRGNGGGPPTAS